MSTHDESMDEQSEPDGLEPYASEPGDLGSKLRSTLRDDDATDVDPADDAVPAIRRRAAQRRQRKVMGLAMAAVVALLIGGSALAFRSAGSSPNDFDVASDGSSSTAVVGTGGTDVSGPDTSIDSASSEMATSSTVASSTTQCVPVTTIQASDGGCAQVVTTTTSGPSVGPCPGSPTCPTVTQATITQPTKLPPTTAPPSSVPRTVPTTSLGTIDCGSSTPSGYPTTTVAGPNLSKCLVYAFNIGQHATLRIVSYNPTPAERQESDYEVIGLHQVKVVYSTTSGAPTTPPATIKTCTAMTNIWPDPALVQVSQCTGL